jgi:hypothetical protein
MKQAIEILNRRIAGIDGELAQLTLKIYHAKARGEDDTRSRELRHARCCARTALAQALSELVLKEEAAE